MDENEKVEEASDLRSDIAAAMDQAEPASPEPAPVEQEAQVEAPAAEAAPPVETAEQKADRDRDDKGRFAKKVESKPEATVEQPKAVEAKPVVEATPPRPDAKAPQSWKPAAREKWSNVPAEIKDEVIRVDREVRKTMQEAAEARQFQSAFQQHIVQPYDGIFRSMGMDAVQGTGIAVQSFAQLVAGPPATKVALVADIIKRYGVDIAALDAALSGQQAPAPQYQQQPQAQTFRDPRVDQLLAQQEQRLEQQAHASIREIEGEEFFGDVREAMADIFEQAARRGVSISPRDAYNRACWAVPDVAEVIGQRQAAQRAANPSGSTQRARMAASSVKGSPSIAPSGAAGDDLRSTIAAAFDRASR